MDAISPHANICEGDLSHQPFHMLQQQLQLSLLSSLNRLVSDNQFAAKGPGCGSIYTHQESEHMLGSMHVWLTYHPPSLSTRHGRRFVSIGDLPVGHL